MADAIVLDSRGARQCIANGVSVARVNRSRNELAVDLAGTRSSAVCSPADQPGNVASAVRTLAPDVVDVSSGVRAPPE